MNKTIVICIWLLMSNLCTGQPYRNLALKGGSIRGIAYIGALNVLEEKNIIQGIERVSGTSVGAIVGSLICLGYNATQMEEVVSGLDLSIFHDGEWFFIGGGKRIRRNYGWYKGKKLETWIGNNIKRQTGNENTTFLQLHQMAQQDKRYKDLYVTATNLTKQKLEVFNWETYPNLPIKIAVRASAAIPLYFGAVFIDSAGNVVDLPVKGGKYNVFVDGGLLANYPINVFKEAGNISQSEYNKITLGLKLERPEQIEYNKHNQGIAPFDIHSFGGYMSSLYNLTMQQLNKGETFAEESKHTIYISTSNLSPMIRHISTETKNLLISNGETATRSFFK